MIKQSKILYMDEINLVINDLRRKAKRSINTRQNLIIFRLATCCGLRASEIAGLQMDDIRLNGRPYIRIRAEIAKRKKAREVPLDLDAGTFEDIANWHAKRVITLGGTYTGHEPFIAARSGQAMDRHNIRRRFIHACGILGADRQDNLTTHSGRHTFVSTVVHRLGLAEAKTWAGHSNVNTTGQYLHIAVDRPKMNNLFRDEE
jgi:integrase